jgi:hypothetical protein
MNLSFIRLPFEILDLVTALANFVDVPILNFVYNKFAFTAHQFNLLIKIGSLVYEMIDISFCDYRCN